MVIPQYPTVKVSFNSINVASDTITGLDSATYPNILVMSLVNTDSIFWIEPDINGKQQLCTTKTFAALMNIRYNIGGVTPSGKVADPFVAQNVNGETVYMPFPEL